MAGMNEWLSTLPLIFFLYAWTWRLSEPDKWKVPYHKSYGETFQEDVMVHGVKSSAHTK